MPNYLERTMINRELKWKWKELLRAQKFKKNSTLDNFTPNFLCPLVTFLNFEITTEMEEGGNKQHSFHMLLTSEPQSYHRIWCVTMNGWTNMFSGAKGPIFLCSCHIDLILYIFVPRFTKNSIIQEILKVKLKISLFAILAKQVAIYTLCLVQTSACSK